MKIEQLIFNHFEYYSQKVGENQLKMWANDLRNFNEIDVKEAIEKLQNETDRIRPATPAQIKDKILNYESSNEAWASVPKDTDESQTYVMTDEARLAWGHVYQMIKDGVPLTNVFFAFKEFYDKLIDEKKKTNAPLKYDIMLGFDKLDREEKIRIAYEKNKISKEIALKFNPYLELPEKDQRYLKQSEKLKLEYKKPVEEEIVLDEATRAQRQKDIQNLIANLGKQIT